MSPQIRALAVDKARATLSTRFFAYFSMIAARESTNSTSVTHVK